MYSYDMPWALLENENVEIYDLSGRRLDKPAKGVNIIGGKTVIVR